MPHSRQLPEEMADIKTLKVRGQSPVVGEHGVCTADCHTDREWGWQ
jgi:hypothetical protein